MTNAREVNVAMCKAYVHHSCWLREVTVSMGSQYAPKWFVKGQKIRKKRSRTATHVFRRKDLCSCFASCFAPNGSTDTGTSSRSPAWSRAHTRARIESTSSIGGSQASVSRSCHHQRSKCTFATFRAGNHQGTQHFSRSRSCKLQFGLTCTKCHRRCCAWPKSQNFVVRCTQRPASSSSEQQEVRPTHGELAGSCPHLQSLDPQMAPKPRGSMFWAMTHHHLP